MKKYKKPTMEIITICNDEILASLGANSGYNPEDESYSKRQGGLLDDGEE